MAKEMGTAVRFMKKKNTVVNGGKYVFWVVAFLILLVGCKSDDEKKVIHLEKGTAYFDAGEYKSAEIELKNALQLDPEYLEAHEMIGKTYLKLGNPQEAFKTYSHIALRYPEKSDAQLKLATFFMLGKNEKKAWEKVNAVLAKEPDNIEALYLQAGLLGREKRYGETEAVYKRILAIDGAQANAWLGLAQSLSIDGRNDDAEKAIRQAIGIDPKASRPRLTLVAFYTGMKKPEQAEQELRNAIELNPDKPDLLIVLGNLYVQNKKNDDAEKAYLKAVELQKESSKPCMIIAGFYEKNGRVEEAAAFFKRAVELKPDDSAIANRLARFYHTQKRTDEAEKLVAEILEKRADYFPALMLKGEMLISERKFDESLAIFEKIVSGEPKSHRAHYFMGLAFYGKNQFERSKVSLGRAIELNPNHDKAMLLLAEIHLRDQDFELAEAKALDVLGRNPGSYRAKLVYGKACVYSKKVPEARKAFGELIEREPENPVAYHQMGLLLASLQESDAARENFKKALTINPMLMDVFSGLILVHTLEKKYDSALVLCDEQLKKVAEKPALTAFVLQMKGQLFLIKKDREGAKRSFQEAIRIYPDYLKPYYALAKIYLSEEKTDEAIAQYATALEKKPGVAQPHMMLGIIYDMKENTDQAEKHYRSALAINPDFAAAANNLAYLLVDNDKDLNEAFELARRAGEIAPDNPGIMDTLGLVYYKKGLYGNAVNEFLDSLEKLPDNADVHYHLGIAYNKKGDTKKARAMLEKALSLNETFEGAEDAREILSKM